MTLDAGFAELTPDRMLDALEAVGLRCDGRMLQLNSYENRVIQVHLEDGPVAVAKFYRPARWTDAQILEEHQFALELAAAEVPMVAPWTLQPPTVEGMHLVGEPATLAVSGAQRFSVSPRCGGRAPELDDPDTLTWIGRFIARLHLVGRQRPFEHRVSWLDAQPAIDARDWLMAHDSVPPEMQAKWLDLVNRAIDAITAAYAAVPELRTLRLHGDCHPGNILWTPDRGPHFVDLDDACTGPAIQDLWMLLSGDEVAARQQLAWVLEGYETFCDFDRRELRLIEPLRTVRMIHHSAWLAKRWNDPAFPLAFPWFGSPNYWHDLVAKLDEQLDAMTPKDERPLTDFRDDGDVQFDEGFR
ncbi:MAG: serine/threonine protein kinase [Burkholderiaceae bacterium]|nr:serine/threonine protein kinase [Burkholderiaceae bacterium]